MALNPITATLGSNHVTSLAARKIVYALGGPWPHRCIIDEGDSNFQVTVNQENSLYYDIAEGVLVYHGMVISNDAVISKAATAATSGKYKKATVFIKSQVYGGLDEFSVDISYSAEGSTADSVSYPTVTVPENNDFVYADVAFPNYNYIPLAHLLIHGNVIESTENLIPAWDNKQFYAPGDEIDLSYLIASGYLAASGANVYFFIPFAKALSMVSGATLSGAVTLRHADGGFIGSNSGQELSSLGTVTISLYESGAYVRCVMNTASQLTNQAPVSALMASGTKLTFF